MSLLLREEGLSQLIERYIPFTMALIVAQVADQARHQQPPQRPLLLIERVFKPQGRLLAEVGLKVRSQEAVVKGLMEATILEKAAQALEASILSVSSFAAARRDSGLGSRDLCIADVASDLLNHISALRHIPSPARNPYAPRASCLLQLKAQGPEGFSLPLRRPVHPQEALCVLRVKLNQRRGGQRTPSVAISGDHLWSTPWSAQLSEELKSPVGCLQSAVRIDEALKAVAGLALKTQASSSHAYAGGAEPSSLQEDRAALLLNLSVFTTHDACDGDGAFSITDQEILRPKPTLLSIEGTYLLSLGSAAY